MKLLASGGWRRVRLPFIAGLTCSGSLDAHCARHNALKQLALLLLVDRAPPSGLDYSAGLRVKWLIDAGFNDVQVERVEGDIINNYYIARKG